MNSEFEQKILDTFTDLVRSNAVFSQHEFMITSSLPDPQDDDWRVEVGGLTEGIPFSTHFSEDVYARLHQALGDKRDIWAVYAGNRGGLFSQQRPLLCGLMVESEGEIYKACYSIVSPKPRPPMSITYF